MKERKVYAAASLEDMTTEWMWDPYIPRGKITMLHGESGVGKTMFAIKLMAACTGKAKLERYGGQIKMGRCLYLTEEEKLAAMIKPKLKDAGAGLEDIFIINDRLPITLADNSLKDIILKNQISLMIIDPISAYLESGFSEENMEDIFTIIMKLARLAEETGCAIVLVEETGGLEDIQTTLWRKTFGSHIPSYLCCTLVTCTPYGVNTHRLLVRGQRTIDAENTEEEEVFRAKAVESKWMQEYKRDLCISFALFGAAMILFMIVRGIRKHRKEDKII